MLKENVWLTMFHLRDGLKRFTDHYNWVSITEGMADYLSLSKVPAIA
jgi:hypothetical protein